MRNHPLLQSLWVVVWGQVIAVQVAFAHMELLAPKSRTPAESLAGQAIGPCGGYDTASKEKTPAVAGDSLLVKWRELIPHPGYFTLRWKGDNETSFTQVLADKIISKQDDEVIYEVMVELPDEPCQACTLQLVQTFMGNNGRVQATYMACADLVVQRKAMPTPGKEEGKKQEPPSEPVQEEQPGDDSDPAQGEAVNPSQARSNQLRPIPGCQNGSGPSLGLLVWLWLWTRIRYLTPRG